MMSKASNKKATRTAAGLHMEVIVVSDDVIFPTNSGGRLELLGECLGLSAAGYDVNLVVSHRLELEEGAAAQHAAIASKVTFLRRHGFLPSTLRHPFLPYQMSSRGSLQPSTIDSLSAESILGVIASHEWTVPLARDIARRLKLPLILRSHNDEIAYMKALANNATGVKRMYFEMERFRLARVLKDIYKSVESVAILSESDKATYALFGVQTQYVPPVLSQAEAGSRPPLTHAAGSQMILFVGALDMPQTAAGLRWFCDEVLPEIQAVVPDAELHVAGRRSSARLAHYLNCSPGVVFHGEVQDLNVLYSKARVFINPVFEGSGVNMKMGPPAERGIPIVTTSVGIRGLERLVPGLLVADEATKFAEECVELIRNENLWKEKSRNARECISQFEAQAVGGMLVNLLERSAS